MPEGKHLNHHWFSNHTVVEIVMNAGEMNAANPGQPSVEGSCADGRLG